MAAATFPMPTATPARRTLAPVWVVALIAAGALLVGAVGGVMAGAVGGWKVGRAQGHDSGVIDGARTVCDQIGFVDRLAPSCGPIRQYDAGREPRGE